MHVLYTEEERKAEIEMREVEERVAVLARVTRGGLTEIVTLSKHLREMKGALCSHLGKSVSDRENSVYKGPEAGTWLHSQGLLRKISRSEEKQYEEEKEEVKRKWRCPCFGSLKDFDFYSL